jgi:lysozyme
MDDDDLLLWVALFAGAVILFQQWRAQTATPGGARSFTPSSPPFDVLQTTIGREIPMVVSPQGIAFVKQEEAFTPTVKKDVGRHSIGYGHTIQPGDNITPPITEAQATDILNDDLYKVAQVINENVTAPLSQNQFDALASLIFNIGEAAFEASKLLRVLNSGDYAAAAQQFAQWRMSRRSGARTVDPVLVGRRQREQQLFLSPY